MRRIALLSLPFAVVGTACGSLDPWSMLTWIVMIAGWIPVLQIVEQPHNLTNVDFVRKLASIHHVILFGYFSLILVVAAATCLARIPPGLSSAMVYGVVALIAAIGATLCVALYLRQRTTGRGE